MLLVASTAIASWNLLSDMAAKLGKCRQVSGIIDLRKEPSTGNVRNDGVLSRQ